jgi:DNA gyrase subunit B
MTEATATATHKDYRANSIQILEGLEAVRKRPAMYIGDIGLRGFHHLVYEVIDNSIDEALAGFCTDIEVVLHDDGSCSITDNGRGIPVDLHPVAGRPAAEVVLTKLHAGGKFDKKNYKVSGGLHGVGVSCVNALSEWLDLTIWRDGHVWRQRFERGIPVTDLTNGSPTDRHGTRVRWMTDGMIFKERNYDWNLLAVRFHELAFLNPGVTIVFRDERNPETIRQESFMETGGLPAFVLHVEKRGGIARNDGEEDLQPATEGDAVPAGTEEGSEPAPSGQAEADEALNLAPILSVSGERDNVSVDIAFTYGKRFSERVASYVNLIHTIEGGTHVSGFRTALTRVVNDAARRLKLLKEKEPNLTGEDLKEGLTAIISVKVPEPQFEGQTKTKLGNGEVNGIVLGLVYEQLSECFEDNPELLRPIVDKASQARRAREAARKARDMVRRQSALSTGITLPGKLADCQSHSMEDAEVFVVEGDSAGGSCKQGRDRHFQAVLPLRGKILNVDKASQEKIFDNKELTAIIQAIGTGVGDKFDISRLRYGKIVALTDADVDGSHIRTLFLTFLWRYMRPLIEGGYVYCAQPPLYRVATRKEEYYCYTEDEMKAAVKDFGDAKVSVQRYKGLGEMNPEQLWATTLDPTRRVMKQITVPDAEEAERLFGILLGDRSDERKAWIMEHAAETRYLDV